MAVAVDDAAGSAKTISNDILSVSIGTPRGVQDITGIDKSAIERLLLLAHGSITLNGVFNSFRQRRWPGQSPSRSAVR